MKLTPQCLAFTASPSTNLATAGKFRVLCLKHCEAAKGEKKATADAKKKKATADAKKKKATADAKKKKATADASKKKKASC